MAMTRMIVAVTVIAGLMGGCAAGIPPAVREAPAGAPSLTDVRAAQRDVTGTRVRWGGTIAGVENRPQETWIEIVERALSSGGRPRETDRSGGRFLARVSGFLDPAVYASGREVTVVGVLEPAVTRAIGEHPYRYAVIKAETVHLWPAVQEPPPYYYDPYWYDPWYPWGPPYPYRRWYY